MTQEDVSRVAAFAGHAALVSKAVVGFRRRFDRFLDTLTAVTIMKR